MPHDNCIFDHPAAEVARFLSRVAWPESVSDVQFADASEAIEANVLADQWAWVRHSEVEVWEYETIAIILTTL